MVYYSVWPFYLFIYLFIYLFVYIFIYLFIYLFNVDYKILAAYALIKID